MEMQKRVEEAVNDSVKFDRLFEESPISMRNVAKMIGVTHTMLSLHRNGKYVIKDDFCRDVLSQAAEILISVSDVLENVNRKYL